MRILFFYNQSDSRTINKIINPSDGIEFEGVPRDEIDVMSPVIRIESESVLYYNYAYIPDLMRYYTVTRRVCYREGVWDIYLDVDVLMSFRGDILNLYAVVDKQSDSINGDEYIDDGSLVTDNVMFTMTYEFPDGFNDNGEYILITAG